jgi:hypothetical protein
MAGTLMGNRAGVKGTKKWEWLRASGERGGPDLETRFCTD